MVDAQLLGQIIGGGLTALASGAAAFLAVRTANRTTEIEDKRAEETGEWERIERLITRACSENPAEAYVGLHMLRESKKDWNDNSKQVAHIRRALDALNAPAIAAYHGGATQVRITPPPGGTVNPP